MENVSGGSEGSVIGVIIDGPKDEPEKSPENSGTVSEVNDIYLTVPDLKRDRAASVDSSFTKPLASKTEELPPCEDLLNVPASGARSRSVDIVLPTSQQARYKALAMLNPPDAEPPPTPPPEETVPCVDVTHIIILG